MEYQGYCVAEIGTNGTGKTTFALNQLRKGDPDTGKHFEKVLILVSDDSETSLSKYMTIEISDVKKLKSGWVKSEIEDPDKCFNELFYNWSGGAIFIDDAMAILDTRNEWVMKFFKKRRQRQTSIILNCHGASEYPVSLFKNTTDFLIFQTLDSLKNIESRMSRDQIDRFRLSVEYVNMVAQTYQHIEKHPLRYFRFNYSLKKPPEISTLNKLIESEWWKDQSKVVKISNLLNK